MHRDQMDVSTAWIGDSDCPPLHISNRPSPAIQNIGLQTLDDAPNVEEHHIYHSRDDYDVTPRGHPYNDNPRNRGGYCGREYER